MSLFVALAIAGLGTFLFRISLLAAHDRFATPAWLQQRLTLVGPSVLAAIVTSSLITTNNATTMPAPLEIVAIGAAVLAVRRTGSLGAALAIGLPIFWLGTFLGLS
ncbi:MAG: AzlD domain-containing protein [Acidimicrobiales bacterium]